MPTFSSAPERFARARRLRRRNRAWLTLLTLAIALSIPVSWGSAGESDGVAERLIAYRDGRLSVRVTEMPLDELLPEIARVTGVEIRGRPEPRKVTTTFTAIPVEEALRRLLGDRNFMLRYGEGRLRVVDIVATSSGMSPTPTPRAMTTHSATRQSPVPTVTVATGTVVTVTTPTVLPQASPGPKFGFQSERTGEARYPPVPIDGRLASELGANQVEVDQLIAAAINHRSKAVRDEALRVGLDAIESDAGLRANFSAWFDRMDNATGRPGLRGFPGEHPEEFLSHVAANARTPELRQRAAELLEGLSRQREVSKPAGP